MKRSVARLFSLMAVILVLSFYSQAAEAFEIGARAYYWFPTLKSNMRVDGDTSRGTEFNVKDNLGLGSTGYPSLEVFGGLGKSHLSLMYTQAEYSDSTILAFPIKFNGSSFAAGAAVNSRLRFKMLDLAYKYDIIDMSNVLAGFSISAIGKVKYIEGAASISSGGNEASQSFKVPIPMVGAGAHIGILANVLEARAELTGITYNGNYLYEGLADLSLTPFPFLAIHGGYKIISIHIDRNDLYFATDLSGPYVAVTVSF